MRKPPSRVKSVRTRWKRAAAVVFTIAVGIWMAPSVMAGASSIRVDLPIRFVFSGDARGIAQPVGVKVGLMTDWNVGVAVERYGVPVNDPQAGLGGVDTVANYQFVDFLVAVRFSTMHLDVGLGAGSVELDPFAVGGQTLSTDRGDADQFLVSLGWPLGPTWEFHVGYHEISASAELQVNGAPSGSTIDLSGVMHSIGLKYTF